MDRLTYPLFAFTLLASAARLPAQQPESQPKAAPTQLTIYNGNFAVARTSVPLDLRAGSNEVLTTDVTSQLEPDSVVLRDPAGQRNFRVVEQNYDAAVVNQQWLLQKYEGKTLQFRTRDTWTAITDSGQIKTAPAEFVDAKIIRAGDNNPLIEVNGHLQFSLPGVPMFPADTEGLLLKPTLRWQIESPSAQHINAELDYITHGIKWEATYNVVVPETKDVTGPEKAEIVGWVTIQNNSGTDFPQAAVQLMAGDVAKLPAPRAYASAMAMDVMAGSAQNIAVTQKEFDDFHLYDLHRTVNLRNKESKQEQFLQASNVLVTRSYEYNGNTPVFPGYAGWHNIDRNFGNSSAHTVDIREEIKNSEDNHLGMPLPVGRLRLYRREATGQMQFVGESQITHTPAGQTLNVTSGNAFDLTGERKQTDFHVDNAGHNMDESFSIKLSNAKSQPVVIHVIEHMNRAENWQITEHSTPFTKQDSATIDFPVSVPAKGDATLTYSVHYTWQ